MCGFLYPNIYVFRHLFHISCLYARDIVFLLVCVMTNLEHDLFLCHVIAAHLR